MGRKTWATEEQNKWLTERKKRFIDAQLNKTSREFLKSTTQCFIEKWPVAEPTDQEVTAEGGVEEAYEAKLNTQRTQIDNWFRNHTRNSAGTSKANMAVLSLARKKVQMLMPYQAYMRLHRTRIMEPIKEAYEKYRKDLPEGKELRNWWPWACEEAARMLSEEPETVQAKVEAFRVKLFQEQTPTALAMEDLMKDSPEHVTKKVRALQNVISMVRRMGLEALKAVEDQTAWKGTLLLGGPDPETGRLVTVAIHNGRTLNLGNMFSEVTEAWPQIQAAFDKFIGQCFHEYLP